MSEAIAFYTDQHFPGPVIHGLRRQSVDILSALEAGRCGFSDSDQLAFATANERVMVTFDSDYLALHNAGIQHAGIAWCPQRKYRIGELVRVLLLLHMTVNSEMMRNHVEHL